VQQKKFQAALVTTVAEEQGGNKKLCLYILSNLLVHIAAQNQTQLAVFLQMLVSNEFLQTID
jgi:hypothetical protein